MIALTTRLNERDETIIQLQEELDAYDRIHRETEEMLEVKSQRTGQLEAILRENEIPFPQETEYEYSKQQAYMMNHENCVAQQKQAENPDIVNYDGQQTYNITKDNLLANDEKYKELQALVCKQRMEIQQLLEKQQKLEMLSKASNMDDSSAKLMIEEKLTQLAQQYEAQISQLNDNIKKSEESQSHLAQAVQDKDRQIDRMIQESSQLASSNQTQIAQYNLEIKSNRPPRPFSCSCLVVRLLGLSPAPLLSCSACRLLSLSPARLVACSAALPLR